ncbi:MAG: hypothetical protein GC190_19795 [Alphaproteobacteria bacterium]|nr:hypothetical protein [Alphaproteobacteria bacterium]
MTEPVRIPPDFYFEIENFARPFAPLPGDLNRPGAMCDLPPTHRLVSSSDLAGIPDWADVRCGWSPKGLAVVFDRPDPTKPRSGLVRMDVWIDTRNTRNIHRATRFCHQFRLEFDPTVTIGRKRSPNETMAPGAELSQIRINRALADAPVAERSAIYTDLANGRNGGFRLALFLTNEALNGFDPDVNRALGFAYRLSAPSQDLQRLGPGSEFPVQEDPSLWTVLQLVD